MPEVVQNIDSNDFIVFDQEVQDQVSLVDYTTRSEIIQAFNEWAADGRPLGPGEEDPFYDFLNEAEQEAVIDKAVFRIKELRRNREDQWKVDWDGLNLRPFYDD